MCLCVAHEENVSEWYAQHVVFSVCECQIEIEEGDVCLKFHASPTLRYLSENDSQTTPP